MLNTPTQHHPRCEVRGLRRGDQCAGYRVPDSKLCLYHDSLAHGRTRPPGGDGYFIPVSGEDAENIRQETILAYDSYLHSNHPEFASLVDTGGLVLDAA
jgi:hypothetical protein